MRVLVACEESQEVCKAFRKRGHEAWSCDIQEPSGGHPEWHLQMDALEAINLYDWDLMIAHPPCTYLAVSGIHWNNKVPGRKEKTEKALEFVKKLMEVDISKICIENPISVISSRIRKPDQIIRPFQFGENSTKATCLWLKNLTKLSPTNIIEPEKHITKSGRVYDKWWFETCLISDLKKRAKVRSKTFLGIAEAMAEQWGDYENN